MNMNKKWTNEWNENEMNKWTGNRIGDEGASKISESLKVNTTLTKLNLYRDEWWIKEKDKERKKNERTNEQVTKLEQKEQAR